MQFVYLDDVAKLAFEKNPIVREQYPTLEIFIQHLRAWGERTFELGYCSSTMGVHVATHRDVSTKTSRPMKNGEPIAVYTLTLDFINEYWKRNPRFR